MTPPVLANSQRKTVPVTIAGTAQTNIITVTTVTLAQLETRFSSTAKARPRTIESETTSSVSRTERFTTSQKVPSLSTLVKPSRPMYLTIEELASTRKSLTFWKASCTSLNSG